MATEVSEMLGQAQESLRKALTALDSATNKVIDKLNIATEYDTAVGSHLAWLASKIAEVTGQLRQLEKHDRLMSRTPAQRFALVVEYIKNEIDPPKRAQLVELLAGMEQERRVLS